MKAAIDLRINTHNAISAVLVAKLQHWRARVRSTFIFWLERRTANEFKTDTKTHSKPTQKAPMPKKPSDDYWSSMITQIRDAMAWSQDELADRLGSNQSTVSRWEKSASIPSPEKQQFIERLAAAANIASIDGLLKIVEASPFPMILVDRRSNVLAASQSSGFKAGLSVIEQTPEDERKAFAQFAEAVAASGFWTGDGKRFDYAFEVDGQRRQAVVQSISARGHIYAVVQRLDV
jgi:transcriptional regulator with XRE-family HTH domain